MAETQHRILDNTRNADRETGRVVWWCTCGQAHGQYRITEDQKDLVGTFPDEHLATVAG